MWYVIQTMTGHEQDLIDTIGKVVDHRIYQRCFFLKREAVWRLQGECKLHEETLFPGYVFIESEHPKELYLQLKAVPAFSRLLGKEDFEFNPVSPEEEIFLKQMLDGDDEYVVRLSPVEVDEQGEIIKCGGALRFFKDYIIKKRIRLCYVIIRVHLLGRDREILLGIEVKKDKRKRP